MLDRVERGEASGIIAWHPDRLARNAVDGGRVIHLVDTGAIADLKFPTFTFEPTAHGKFVLQLMFGQSKYYVDSLSENITRGRRQKIKSGIWPAYAPIGYLNDRKTRTVVPDPKNGPLIAKMFELYATGAYTLHELCRVMTAMGLVGTRGGPFYISGIQYTLQNPFYYGLMRFKGEYFEGKHTPLITQAVFDRCQAVMRDSARPKSSGFQPFAYRRLMRCGECGATITMEVQKGHQYLRCTKRRGPCTQPYVRAEAISQQVATAIRMASISQSLGDSLLTILEQEAAADRAGSQARQVELRQQLAECDRRRDRLMDLYLSGELSEAEFKENKNRLVLQRRQHQTELDQIAAQVSGWFEPSRRWVKACVQAGYVASGGSPVEQADFLRQIGSNLSLKDRWLQWVPRGPWQLIVGQEVVQMGAVGQSGAWGNETEEERERRIKRRGGESMGGALPLSRQSCMFP